MTGAGPSIWERRRARSRLEIELAGLQLVADRGLDQVTVEQIAAHAGISVRTFYRYFRNVPELLVRVPEREVERSCRLFLARPADEGILDAIRAAVSAEDPVPGFVENSDLRVQTLMVWSQIAQADPDLVAVRSQVLAVMTAGYQEVITTRYHLEDSDGEATAAIFAAAIAGVIWSVYVRFLAKPDGDSLPSKLDDAFGRLAMLWAAPFSGGPAASRRRVRR